MHCVLQFLIFPTDTRKVSQLNQSCVDDASRFHDSLGKVLTFRLVSAPPRRAQRSDKTDAEQPFLYTASDVVCTLQRVNSTVWLVQHPSRKGLQKFMVRQGNRSDLHDLPCLDSDWPFVNTCILLIIMHQMWFSSAAGGTASKFSMDNLNFHYIIFIFNCSTLKNIRG